MNPGAGSEACAGADRQRDPAGEERSPRVGSAGEPNPLCCVVDVVDVADRNGISINASTAPWAALDMDAKGFGSVVHASPHYINTEDELERLIDVVDQLR